MGRVKQALDAGFRHLVFEDNYDTGTGDHYSLRQICDQFYIRGTCCSLSVLLIFLLTSAAWLLGFFNIYNFLLLLYSKFSILIIRNF